MQKLHLVGFTASFDGLIFSARKGAKSGNYVVPLDGRLLKQIAEAERLRDGGPARPEEGHRKGTPRLVRPESSLSPREMQDRIRAGWSVDEVAAEAGVDLDWVSRFAAPVLAEVRQVLEQGRAAVFDKPRVGLSALPLGASVRRNILDRGVQLTEEDLDECWSAYQLEEDVWVLRFEYTSRGRSQEAEWVYDVEGEELSSRNRLGSQLGHATKGRPRRSAAAPKPSAEVVRAAKSAKAATARAATRTTTAPAPAKAAKAAKAVKPAPARRPAAKTAKARTPAAPRKKAGSRPAKKPAKERAPVATPPAPAPTPLRKSGLIRPMAMPTPTPVPSTVPRRPVARSPRPEEWAPDVPRRQVVIRPEPPLPPAPLPVVEAEPRPEPRVVEVPLPEPEPAMPQPLLISPPEDELRAPPPERPFAAEIDVEPPQPGAAEVDEENGIARIDSRRMSHYVSGPPPRATFRGDVSRAEGVAATPPRPRRTEPLRGR